MPPEISTGVEIQAAKYGTRAPGFSTTNLTNWESHVSLS